MAEATSKISPVVTNGTTTYTATKVTGPDPRGNYSSEIVQYDDANGNEVLSNARLLSTIELSTDEYSCSYNITYTGNNERKVECTSGCDEGDDNSTFCEQYRYNDEGFEDGSLWQTLLDQTYVGRRRARTNP